MNEHLILERQRLEQAWHRYVDAQVAYDTAANCVAQEVVASWERSSHTVSPERVSAPLESEPDARHAWNESRLEHASRPVLAELTQLADDSDMVIALGDNAGQLLWTYGSERMQRLARSINFVPGGHWDEFSVGTNALALSLQTRLPVRVFGPEHYVQSVHDWVCYSAPITDTETGELLGVLDFSTTWERSTPLGLASTQHYAQVIERGLRQGQNPAGVSQLTLQLCGPPRVQLNGQRRHLTPRQQEVLAVLALNPEGLTLDSLHAHVYGDQAISLSTLKAEMSGLRGLLGGQIASRPYRLTAEFSFDVLQVEQALLSADVGRALDCYNGLLLPHSASPLLSYWRDYLDAALREAALRSQNPELLWRYVMRFPDCEVLLALEPLIAQGDPRLPMVRARRAALESH